MINPEVTKHPEISVLMPTYNEPLCVLDAAVASILAQTFTDFELLLLLDNPNNEDHLEYAKSVANRDRRVRVIRNEQNLGLPLTLNKGIRNVRGFYICRMDSDDISCPDRLEMQLSYLKDNELDLVGASMIVIDETGDPLYSVDRLPSMPPLVRKALRFNNCVPHPTWFGRAEVFEQLYRLAPYCEDYDFLVRAQLAGFKLGNVPKCLVRYRMSEASISRSHLFEQFLYQVELTRAYSEGRVLDIDKSKMIVAKKLSSKKKERYSRANAIFNEALSQVQDRSYLSAAIQMIRIPFLSIYYLRKMYRLMRAALVRA